MENFEHDAEAMAQYYGVGADEMFIPFGVEGHRLELPNGDGQRAEKDEPEPMSVIKKILEQEILSDVIIKTNNGVEVKCHKSFLAAHSPVFSAMLSPRNGELQEQQSSTIEIPEVGESGAKALLAYLYYWDKTEVEKNSAVAYELLLVGHKYDISVLEKYITKLILRRPNTWMEADVAVKLFGYTRNMPSGEKLKLKAIDVMKTKRSELKQCPTYQELFNESPEVAMELCDLAFQI